MLSVGLPGQLGRGRHPLGWPATASVRKGCLINHLPQFPVVKSRTDRRLWTHDVNNLTTRRRRRRFSRAGYSIEVTSRVGSARPAKHSTDDKPTTSLLDGTPYYVIFDSSWIFRSLTVLPFETWQSLFRRPEALLVMFTAASTLLKCYIIMSFGCSRSFKVIQGRWFWYQSKARTWLPDFLLVINSNYGPILHRFWDTAIYWLKIAYFSHPSLIWRPRSLCSLWNFAAKITVRKLESGAILQWRPHDCSWSRFDTVPACDRQTDGQTDGFTIAMLTRCKTKAK